MAAPQTLPHDVEPVPPVDLQNNKSKTKSAAKHAPHKEKNPSPQAIKTLTALFTKGRYTEAATFAQTMTARFPLYRFGWMILGLAFKQIGRGAEALEPMQKAAALSPTDADAHNNLGIILMGMGRLDEAETSYRRALEIKPDFAVAHNNLGLTLKDLGRLDEAAASFRRALEIKPDYADAHYNLGNILCDLGDIAQAIAVYQKILTIDPQNFGMEAAVSLATLYYLDGSIERCRNMLEVSRPINAASGSAHEYARTYWGYLNSLLADYQEHNGEKHQRKDLDALYVVGDSHSLSAHGVVVRYHGQEMNCTAKWLEGCKQWHLGNSKPNRFKHRFEGIMKTLPHESMILLLIGEIDCRPDEGIIKAWKKSQGTSLEEVAKATAASYVSYVTGIAAKFGHRVIVGGIPATNIRLDTLDTETAGQLVRLIRLFNTVLKDQALAASMDFLDVYALTDRGDGIASGEWHIDNNHLLPSAITEAFSKHLVASEHPGSPAKHGK